jgi:hypothetical protein
MINRDLLNTLPLPRIQTTCPVCDALHWKVRPAASAAPPRRVPRFETLDDPLGHRDHRAAHVHHSTFLVHHAAAQPVGRWLLRTLRRT